MDASVATLFWSGLLLPSAMPLHALSGRNPPSSTGQARQVHNPASPIPNWRLEKITCKFQEKSWLWREGPVGKWPGLIGHELGPGLANIEQSSVFVVPNCRGCAGRIPPSKQRTHERHTRETACMGNTENARHATNTLHTPADGHRT